SRHKEICFDTETDNIDPNIAALVGMSFSVTAGEAYYVPVPADRDEAYKLVHAFAPLFENPEITWVGQNIKYDLVVLKWYNQQLRGPVFDTMVAHYLVEPDGRHNMDALAQQYLNYAPISINTLIGKKGKTQITMREAPLEAVAEYAAEDADITLQLKYQLEPQLNEK